MKVNIPTLFLLFIIYKSYANPTMSWEETSWVYRGRLRRRILEALEAPKTATRLEKELDTHRSTISQSLIEMTGKGLLECLDKDQPYNRFYKRTSKGDEINTEVQKLIAKEP